MADEDDLDAFFDEVSAVEANVSDEVESEVNDDINNNQYGSLNDNNLDECDNTTSTLKRPLEDESIGITSKKQKSNLPPPRPLGVVVASASVRPAEKSSVNNKQAVSLPLNKYQNQQQQQQYVGPSLPTTVYNNNFLVPPPPPPPPLPLQLPPLPHSHSGAAITAKNTSTVGSGVHTTTAHHNSHTQKTGVIRTAAGKVWVDESLADWPDNDYRIFVGNIDPAVQDQQLFQHFASKYTSVARSKIVRDPTKKVQHVPTTTMHPMLSNVQGSAAAANAGSSNTGGGVSKGYGFISFTNALECAKAIREMDQTWLGSRPIRVKRSHWKERDLKERKKKENEQIKYKKKLGLL